MESPEASSNRFSLISKLVRDALKRRLSRFLENPNIEAQGSLARTDVTLKRLTLREDALDMYVLPVSVTRQSMVETLKASFPLTAFGKKPVELELANIRIFAVPNEVNWTDFGLNKEKAKKLDEWNEERKSEFRDMDKKGWIAALKQKVLNNIKQTIRNLEIVYLDNKSMGYPCFVRIYIGRLEIETTNASWQPEFSHDQTATHRLITITEFSIALVADKYEVASDIQDMHEYYKRISLSERHYLLKPCKITIKHRLSHTDPLEEPWNSVRVETAGLEVAINEMQFQYIKHLLNYIDFKQSYKKYQVTRPPGTVQENPRAWWDYLVTAAKHDTQANFKVLYENKERMERYVDLFKRHQDIIHSPWLQQLKKNEVDELARLEEELPVNDILFYRSVALNHLRIEAMQYVRAKGNVKGITHLGDLWDYYLNDFESLLGDPNQQVAREEEVEMNREEKQELKILMSMDKQQALKSLLSGKSSTAHDQTFKVDFSIKSLIFYLQKTEENLLESFEFFDRKQCTCNVCTLKPKDRFASRLAKAGKFGKNLVALSKGERRVMFPGIPNIRSGEVSDDEEDSKKIVNRSLLRQLDSDAEGDKSIDYVVEVEKITHDDPDPRLLGEYTLIVLNFDRITGKVGVLRNGRLWTEDDAGIAIEKILAWDPIALKDADLRREFFKAYKLKNLLDDLIEMNVNDDPAFYSLKHFMRLSGQLPVFEFYVHHKEVTPTADAKGMIVGKTTHRYCSCGHSYSHETLLNVAFRDSSSTQYFIHMSDQERPSDIAEMSQLAAEVEKKFAEHVLPYFVRRCARWVFPSSLRKVMPEEAKGNGRRQEHLASREQQAESAEFRAFFEFLGEKNPIEVTFGQSPQRLHVGDEKKRSHLRILLTSPSMILSNTTASSLVQWLDVEETDTEVFAKESLNATFRERIKRMRPELFMVTEFHKQAQKDVRHLYNYMKDIVRATKELTTEVKINSLRISLLDEKNIGKYVTPPIIVMELKSIELTIDNRAEARDLDSVSTDRPRHGMAKDLKFYKVVNVSISSIVLKSMKTLLLNSRLKLALCECLVAHHPELPDLVVDLHIPVLAVEISNAMLPLLSFLDNLHTEKKTRPSEDTFERRSDASLGFEPLFKVDLNKTKTILKKLNKDHYKNKTPCGHCQIMYTKHRKLVYFSIGSVGGQDGLSISMLPDGALQPSLTVKVPMVVFTFLEKCFLKTASLLMAEVSLEGVLDEEIILTVHNSKHCSFPMIPAKVFEQLPHLRDALHIKRHYEEDEVTRYAGVSMHEVMTMRQHIHPDVYTEKEWLYREGEYLRNKQQRKIPGRDSFQSLKVLISKPLQDSKLLASVLGVSRLLNTSKKITPVVPPTTIPKKKGKLSVVAEISQVEFQCSHREAQLMVSMQNLSFRQTPHKSQHDFEPRKCLETIEIEANCLNLSIKTGDAAEDRAALKSVSGAMDQIAGTYELVKEHSQLYHKGIFRLSGFYISDTSNPSAEVLLLAAESTINRDTIMRPTGKSVVATYDEAREGPKVSIEVEPVCVLLKAEIIIGLKLFFEKIAKFANFRSPLDPEKMLNIAKLPRPVREEGIPLRIQFKSIQGILGALGTNFLTLELKEFCTVKESESMFSGTVGRLGLKTRLKNYPDALEQDGEGPMLSFSLDTAADRLELDSSGLRLLFLSRLVDEIVGYVRMISKKEKDEKLGEGLKYLFTFHGATMIMPNSSDGADMVILEFEELRVKNGSRAIKVKRPSEITSLDQLFKKQEFDVPILPDSDLSSDCELLSFRGTNTHCLVRYNKQNQRFGLVPVVKVSMLNPPGKDMQQNWSFDFQVNVKTKDPLLVPSLSDFVHFVDIIEANVDEKSPLFDKTTRVENTRFDIEIQTGTIEVDKWVNAPSEEPQALDIEGQVEDVPAEPPMSEIRLPTSISLVMPIAELESEHASDHEEPGEKEDLPNDDALIGLLNALS